MSMYVNFNEMEKFINTKNLINTQITTGYASN